MRRKATCTHEWSGWPKLTWRGDSLAAVLAGVRYKQGVLLGRMQSLGFDLRAEATLAVLTSAIFGNCWYVAS